MSQLGACNKQGVQRTFDFRHADKRSFVFRRYILLGTEQNFMRGTVVACQVDDEAIGHAFRQAARFIKLPYVEQIAGMLAIKRCDQFASVQFIAGKNGRLELNAKQSLVLVLSDRYSTGSTVPRNTMFTSIFT